MSVILPNCELHTDKAWVKGGLYSLSGMYIFKAELDPETEQAKWKEEVPDNIGAFLKVRASAEMLEFRGIIIVSMVDAYLSEGAVEAQKTFHAGLRKIQGDLYRAAKDGEGVGGI